MANWPRGKGATQLPVLVSLIPATLELGVLQLPACYWRLAGVTSVATVCYTHPAMIAERSLSKAPDSLSEADKMLPRN